jgi:hypothetical protein
LLHVNTRVYIQIVLLAVHLTYLQARERESERERE